jgi:hypothetical protein
MLEKLKYVNNQGEVFKFGVAGVYANENDLRDFGWSYDSDNNKIGGFTKSVTTKSLSVIICAETKQKCRQIKKQMYEVFEKDVLAESPGKLYIGDYYLPCYIVKSVKSDYLNSYRMSVNLTIVTEADTWFKDLTIALRPGEQAEDLSGRGYNYGYEYDYSSSSGNSYQANQEGFCSCDFIFTIYGYADNPEIIINNHVYKLNYTVQKDEQVAIDSRKKRITLTKKNGATRNLFRYRDKTSDIFEKVPSGNINIYLNNNYDCDIMLLLERSEPEWT